MTVDLVSVECAACGDPVEVTEYTAERDHDVYHFKCHPKNPNKKA